MARRDAQAAAAGRGFLTPSSVHLALVHTSPAALARLGLRLGEPIRFRRTERSRWIVGKVAGVEIDGSVALRDPDGSARSIRPESVQVRRPGSRGRLTWQVVSDVAITWEQLELFEDPSP
jgi:hypothetical protein